MNGASFQPTSLGRKQESLSIRQAPPKSSATYLVSFDLGRATGFAPKHVDATASPFGFRPWSVPKNFTLIRCRITGRKCPDLIDVPACGHLPAYVAGHWPINVAGFACRWTDVGPRAMQASSCRKPSDFNVIPVRWFRIILGTERAHAVARSASTTLLTAAARRPRGDERI